MAWEGIEDIINRIPIGIAVVETRKKKIPFLSSSLSYGRWLGISAYDAENATYILRSANAFLLHTLHISGSLKGGMDFSRIMEKYVYKDDLELVRKTICDAFLQKTTCDFRLCMEDDKRYWIEMEGEPIEEECGGRLASFRFLNITERKSKEISFIEELDYMERHGGSNMLSKGRYNLSRNTVMNYSVFGDEALSVSDRETYDNAMLRLIGMIMDEKDRAAVKQVLLRGNLLEAFDRGETHFEMKYRRWQNSGAPIWILKICDTFRVPYTDEIECFVCSYDVTEKTMTENIISRMSELEYDYFGLINVQNGTFTVFRSTSDFRYADFRRPVDYNFAMENKIRSNQQITDHSESIHALSLETVRGELSKSGIYRYSCGFYDRDGSERWTNYQFCYLNPLGEEILFLESDITAQKKQEAEKTEQMNRILSSREKAVEAKSSFFSSMSHDLRTPLNGVIGFTDMAIKETDAAKKQIYLGKIKLSCNLLLDLVNDTLDISRIDSGKMVLEPEVLDEKNLVDSVLTALKPSADLKKISMECSIPAEINGKVYGDRVKLQKIMLNILSNAIKYTPEGGYILFKLERLAGSADGMTRRLTIRDNGIGMHPDFIRKMYEPFSQEHRPEAANVIGTGLGLSIVKRITDMMGGTIQVESTVGRGTSFVVLLPLQETDQAWAEKERSGPETENLKGKVVLLCEDNYLNREIAEYVLKEKGIRVVSAGDGAEALGLYRGSAPGTFDAILMDIHMPVMDGYEASQAIRSLRRPDAAGIPIIAMTADAFPEDVDKAIQAGMNAHITKPIDTSRLSAILSKFIR